MSSAAIRPTLKDPSLLKQAAFINGNWIDAKGGKTFAVLDPASDTEIGTLPEQTAEDARKAIECAEEAFNSFKKTTPRERATLLTKWYNLCVENADDLASIISWENGKTLAEAKGEVTYGNSFFQWFAEESPRAYGDMIPSGIKGNRVLTIKQPLGVVGLITPWNFPHAMYARKVAAAIAAGCTVVLKPGGETPFTALAVAELGQRAGVPKGVFNVVTCLANTPDVGKELTTNPIVKKISFTGSTGVGKILMKQAADTVKKVSFELGGNAPFIVFEDADLDKAVAAAVACKFRGTGQTCICANRFFIHESLYDIFIERFSAEVAKFKVGAGLKEGSTHGPLIHSRAVDKVESLLQDAVSKGGKIVIGGKRLTELGNNFFAPTIIKDCTTDMAFAQEEIFGPIAAIYKFSSEAEVLRLANDTNVGLAGYFFSQDVGRIFRVAEELEVGMIGANTGIISDAALPFGGIKESGLGREGSKYGLDEYLKIKAVTLGGLGL
ncbi:NAD-dependent aldehyde dehydrogenase [Protomyces lactucae-debilis]|uniref:Succinate-semialdehyde dehydrogenase n=1 Tax=Protomyces lactucae-debilis TaxID=2754530 RepID=A0A1Y2FUX8_PROLT|nr:NAD-dependent aldehyde dehydrogenase [Protomyces lactucae-debilis]ORY87810.1 NAD-dependent aldehyde dehydrogenase [Protomyces lactucae-debilis]